MSLSYETMNALCMAGGYAAIALAAVGSSLGTGMAGMAAVGAWKKCYAQNKPAPFLLLAYAGAPLSQTIYGLIMMIFIKNQITAAIPAAGVALTADVVGKAQYALECWPLFLIMGIVGGIAMGISAMYQGKAGAASCVAYAETGKGFANNLMVLGVVETVAIFALVFCLLAMPSGNKNIAAAKAGPVAVQVQK
ncbi:MAG: hypothetical protein PHQ27_00350 [Victivallales bacterium]|nr:hypothetical protein [Victivallales bacterium]